MIDNSPGQEPVSPDIEQRQKALKIRIYDWKKKGYNVTSILNLIQQDILMAERSFEGFLRSVDHLRTLEERLYRLDTEGFEDRIKDIEDRMKDTDAVDELEHEVILLEEAVLEKKLGEARASGSREEENTLRRQLERIRGEELDRIRAEESDRLREQERERILQEELERIRKEERERLKASELERIRKEERERLVWEERVVKQLRQVKESEKERKTGSMTCPSCKGTISIPSPERPLKVRCSSCGKDYTLRGKDDDTLPRDTGPGMAFKTCPRCTSRIPIVSEKRPLKIICQNCNAEYLLKGKKEEGRSAPKGRQGSKGTPTPSRDTRSPGLEITDHGSQEFTDTGPPVTCTTCNREIPGDAKICGYCGAPVERTGKDRMAEARCLNCGKDISREARICGYCGTPVGVPGQRDDPFDSMELPPLSPIERINEDREDRKVFKPLNEYNLPPGNPPSTPGADPGQTRGNRPVAPSGQTPGAIPGPTRDNRDGGTGTIPCPKCGNTVPRGAKFCGVCGNSM